MNATARIDTLSEKRRALFELLVNEGKRTNSEKAPIPKRQRAGHGGLSYAQARLWFLDQLVPGNPFYNCRRRCGCAGRWTFGHLRRSINEIVRRHEALRTRFEIEEGKPAQVIAPELKLTIQRRWRISAGWGRAEAELRRRVKKEAEQPFELARGPLLRVRVLRLGKKSMW